MKRTLITAVIIAIVVGAVAIISHATGWFAAIDLPLKNWLQKLNGPSHDLSKIWQHNLIVLLGLGTAWMTLTSARRHNIAILVLAVMVELLGLTWVCSLYHVFFAPLPAIIAVALSYGAALAYLAFAGRKRGGIPLSLFNGKLSGSEIARLRSGEIEFDGSARAFETSVVVCDLANKYDLADNDDPSVVTTASEKFTARAAELLRDAGAYLHAADGEGVVAVFGFPGTLEGHAEKAVRAAFHLARAFQPVEIVVSDRRGGVIALHQGEAWARHIFLDPQRLRDRPRDELRVADGRKRDEEHPSAELVQQLGGALQRQARLADPTRPG